MSNRTLTTLAVIVVATAASSSALAGGCGGGKKYYGGSNLHHRYISKHNQGVYKHVYHKPVVVHKPVVIEKRVIDHCHHPKFCVAYVRPGDTLLSICGREYGNPNFWSKVAAFNHMPAGAPLAAGQPIKLPSIYNSGRMIASDAPAPPAPAVVTPVAVPAGPAPRPGFSPQPSPQGQPGQQQQLQVQPISNPSTMNIRQAERVMPTFTAGSQLVLDGQQFGGTPGQVRLVLGPMELPVGISNWTPSEVTIKLPELPLTKASDARIVILDASGKLVTQSEIRLAPATSRLAMGN